MRKYIKICFVFLFVSVCVWTAEADLDILVIGSSTSVKEIAGYLEHAEQGFSPVNIGTELQRILEADPAVTQPVNVVVDDYHRSEYLWVTEGYSGPQYKWHYVHTLAQHYFWLTDRSNTLANLRGELGTNWDYVVMMDDSHTLGNIPGFHAEGVNLIANEVRKGGAEP
ncbi:hypothetical protein ACFLS1_10105, partial [Verrucomicrobiota bacterium]